MRPWACRGAISRGVKLELDAHRKIARHPVRQPERPQAPAHPASAPQLDPYEDWVSGSRGARHAGVLPLPACGDHEIGSAIPRNRKLPASDQPARIIL